MKTMKYKQTNEILKICTRFYTELYSSTFQDQHPSLENASPESSEIPPIMTSEVKKTTTTNKQKQTKNKNKTKKTKKNTHTQKKTERIEEQQGPWHR